MSHLTGIQWSKKQHEQFLKQVCHTQTEGCVLKHILAGEDGHLVLWIFQPFPWIKKITENPGQVNFHTSDNNTLSNISGEGNLGRIGETKISDISERWFCSRYGWDAPIASPTLAPDCPALDRKDMGKWVKYFLLKMWKSKNNGLNKYMLLCMSWVKRGSPNIMFISIFWFFSWHVRPAQDPEHNDEPDCCPGRVRPL